ncbi:hypothetical protein GH714_016611 [Hevea brasiliensis]|uniref:Disease resistance protein At4g27190-like leucine-rich repeats domain-containing protein n=1 Tax=Hevea brasiliensis TaxID=3981 RepID=A0A6A6KS93_HEVBR|nr:hypothetical protein GH714_016611 [Hevea brasiliensis]
MRKCCDLEMMQVLLRNWMKVLMGKAEVLNLIEVTNLKEVISTDECVEQGYLVDALQGIPRDLQRDGGNFYNSEVDDEVEFPELTDLELRDLPNFLGFIINKSLSWKVSLIKNQQDPSVIHIDEKKETYYAFPSKLIEGLQNLQRLEINALDSVEVIFSFKGLILEEYHATTGVLNSMEEMRFRRLSNLKHVCFKIPSEIKAFQKLRKLEVESCDNLINLFSPALAKLLEKLKEIKITSCKMMEEIIGKEDEEKQEESMQKIVFPQLSSLIFGNLPNFKGFYSGIYALELPKIQKLKIFDEKCTVNESLLTRLLIRRKNTLRRIEDGQPSDGDLKCLQKLEKLSVRGCGSLMEIFDFEGVNADDGNVVTLSHLEEVWLSHLPKLVHIFNKIPKNVIGFQKLRKLNVYDCNSLRNILSVAVAKCLVQLQELDIRRCHMLEEIIVPKEDEKEEASNDIIVFPELKSLKLDQLPSLKNFCNGIYALEFPLLEKLDFWKCEGMKTFSYGSLRRFRTLGLLDPCYCSGFLGLVCCFFGLPILLVVLVLLVSCCRFVFFGFALFFFGFALLLLDVLLLLEPVVCC